MDAWFNETEARAWGGFLSTHGRLSRRLEENLRRTSDLSHAEYEVLLRLSGADGRQLRLQTLASESVLSHSGISRLVDRLEQAGLVERIEAKEDRRGAYAVLTDRGAKHFAEAARQHTALVHELFLSKFSAEELTTMASFWARLDDI